jgi:hypothetical protein
VCLEISFPVDRDRRVTAVLIRVFDCRVARAEPPLAEMPAVTGQKKADALERTLASNRVGLLVNGPPTTSGLPFT